MSDSLKWKLLAILGTILLALYVLVPTLFGFPQIREELEAKEEPPPWYFKFFPEKGINLGLDLRGGIYVELEVLVQEGIKAKIDILAQDILRDLKRRQMEVSSVNQANGNPGITLVFDKNADVEDAKIYLSKDYQDYFQNMEILKSEKPSLQLVLHPDYFEVIRKDILSQAVQAVRNRIDRYGLAEPTVQRHGEKRIVVELPGVKDPERALKIVKQAGKLEFKLVNESLSSKELGDMIGEGRTTHNLSVGYSFEEVTRLNEVLKEKLKEGTEVAFELTRDPNSGQITQAKPYILDKTAYITGDMLKNAQVQNDPQTGKPYVSLSFNPEGAKIFADLTTAHVKGYLAILLDGNVASAPQIREPIRNGLCRIDLGANINRQKTLQEAKDLTLVLQEGALPARLKEVTKSVIGPTLGQDSIDKSLKSILVGSLFVIAFMVIYYKLSGWLANLALIVNTLFIFALLAMFQATLTLPGMAGIALTIGMAVDANILIFERIREELRAEQPPRQAVVTGYQNAVRAIMDSNLTTILSGIILYQFGTGPIRGFAVTLMIGLVCNLFTAVWMTRAVYDFFVIRQRVQTISI